MKRKKSNKKLTCWRNILITGILLHTMVLLSKRTHQAWMTNSGYVVLPKFASLSFFKIIYLFIYFLAVLGLHFRFCARASSSCGKRGPLFIAVRGPLTIVTSLVAEHRLQTRRLSNCGSRAWSLRGMWDLPRPGLEPVSPTLAGRFSTTVPPGKPQICFSYIENTQDWIVHFSILITKFSRFLKSFTPWYP